MSNIQKHNQNKNNQPKLRPGQKDYNELSLEERKLLSAAQKKEYLLQKYQKKKFELSDIRQYGVFMYPEGGTIGDAKLISTHTNLEDAEFEILWRAEFHIMGNTDIAVQNDKRLETFEDETLHLDENGCVIEPTDEDMSSEADLMRGTDILDSLPERKGKFKSLAYYANMELNYEGMYFIMPLYPAFDPHIKKNK